MKPEWILFKTLRTRGVVFSSSPGILSTVKPCGGTLSSKSSGARRFLPTAADDRNRSGIVIDAVCLSGVRALKTGGSAALLSGVFGRGREDGPETVRFVGTREIGVEGTCRGIGGTGGIDVKVFARGRPAERIGETGVGVLDELGAVLTASDVAFGIAALAAVSFVCKFCTLRARDSTLVVSFLFSFNILYDCK